MQHDKETSDIDKIVQSHQASLAQLIEHQKQQQQQQYAIVKRVLNQQRTTINRLVKSQQIQHQALTHILQQLNPERQNSQQQQQQLRYQHLHDNESMVPSRNGVIFNKTASIARHQNEADDAASAQNSPLQVPDETALTLYDYDQHSLLNLNDVTYLDLDNFKTGRRSSPLEGNEINESPQLVIDLSDARCNTETRSHQSFEADGNPIDDSEGDDDYDYVNNNSDRNMMVQPDERQRQQNQVNYQKYNIQQQDHKRDIRLPAAPLRDEISAQTISNIQRHQTLKRLMRTKDVKKYAEVINRTALKLVRHMLDQFASPHGTLWKDLAAPFQRYGQNALELELLKQNIPIIRCCDQWFAAQTMEQVWNHLLQNLQRDSTRTKQHPYNGISTAVGSRDNSVSSSEVPANSTKERQRQPEAPLSPTRPKKRKRTSSTSSAGAKQEPRPQPKVVPEP